MKAGAWPSPEAVLTQRRRKPRKALSMIWPHFDLQRSEEAHGDLGLLFENPVGVSVPRGSNQCDLLYAIAKATHRPFPVKSISEKLKGSVYTRGRACFEPISIGNLIEKVISGHPNLRWWIEAEGLVVDEARADLDQVLRHRFDRVAGPLLEMHWSEHGLSEASLLEIAEVLDRSDFHLLEELQPAQRKPIAAHNQKHARKPIRTFLDAARHDRFARNLRRRLYVARNRYLKVISAFQPR